VTNQAISAILEHLCNTARSSPHSAVETAAVETAAVETVESGSGTSPVAATPAPAVPINYRAGVDQLLRSLDDLRDLLSSAPPESPTLEEFDLERCASEVLEALNLASGIAPSRVVLDSRAGPYLLTQDHKATLQVLTRVLDVAMKLSPSSGVHVAISAGDAESRLRVAVHTRDADLAVRLTSWLYVDRFESGFAGEGMFEDPGEVSFKLAVMVAGKCLRALGGTAGLERDSVGHCAVALQLPSQNPGIGAQSIGGGEAASSLEAQLEALNILVAEDFDESFTLTSLVLEGERLWRARDGQEALDMLQKQRFDVVLMDVHMPGMDGYAAIRGMREWETQTGSARTPIVVLSSDDVEMQRKSAAQCGCSGFLRKPLVKNDIAVLLDRLKQVRAPA
jgi:CheY-like chemotaxis protein